VGRGAEQAGFDEDAVFEIELACDEACTNIIEHTYRAENVGNLQVRWEIRPDAFVVTIHDNGDRFDPSSIPPPPVPPDPAVEPEEVYDIKVGGLGVFFMRELMDDVRFAYEEGSGNVLTMRKHLPEEAER
jgi:serine/threonine-protein kinase RsbW